jgi:hypothetical protein
MAPGHPVFAQGATPTTATIAARSTAATVTIVALAADGDTIGLGSGFFIGATGVLVTNWHVMQGAERALVVRENGERFERVGFVDGDSTADIALLKVPGYALPVLPTRADVPAVGERVIAIGSPLGLSQTVSEGIVSAHRVVDGRELVQISAAISPGSSGGAVLDATGRVFAISTSYMDGGQQLNFAVPIKYALGLVPAAINERPLASVFAGQRAVASNAPRAAAAKPTRGKPPLPSPAQSPRTALEGVWLVDQRWYDANGDAGVHQIGLLFARDRVGMLILARTKDDSTLGPTKIWGIDTWRATPDGQIAMAVSNVEYGGYQTADGLALEARARADDGNEYELQLLATPHRLAIADNSGLYEASARAFYTAANGKQTPTPIQWVGDMAVGFAAGTICVDVSLENSVGGTAGLYSCGPFGADGNFRLIEEEAGDRTVLDGSLRAGVLRAHWVDQRKSGASFEGDLEAKRRQ